MQRKNPRKASFACAVLLLALGATAATRTWTAGGDASTWTDAANWDGAAPGAGDTAAFTNNATIASPIQLSGDITVNVANGFTVYLSGVISGTGGITKAGAGKLSLLNLDNSYDGPTVAQAGTLSFASIANIGETSALGCPTTSARAAFTIQNSAIVRLEGFGPFYSDRPVSMSSKGQFYAVQTTCTLTLTGPFAGRCYTRGRGTFRLAQYCTAEMFSSVSRTDAGCTDFLCPTNSFSNGVSILDGTYLVPTIADAGVPCAIGTGSRITFGQCNYSTTGVLSYYGTSDASCNRDISVWGCTNSSLNANHHGGRLRSETAGVRTTYDGTFTVQWDEQIAPQAMPTLYLDGAGDGQLSMALPDRLILYKQGSGTWSLADASAVTGTVFVQEGRLDVAGTLAAPVRVCADATLAPGTLDEPGTLTIGAAGLVISNGAHLAFRVSSNACDRLAAASVAFEGTTVVDVEAWQSDIAPGTYTLMKWTSAAGTPSFSLGASSPRRTSLSVVGNSLHLSVGTGTTYRMSAVDAIGETSLNQVGHWVLASDGTTPATSAPCAGNDYVTTYNLRTPENSSVNHIVFGGDTLTLDNGGGIAWKMKTGQSVTVSNLVVAGNCYVNNSLDKTIARYRGRISIASGKTFRVLPSEPHARAIIVESDISGDANTCIWSQVPLTNSVVSPYKYVSLTGDNREFYGRHRITGNGQFYVAGPSNIGTPPTTCVANSFTFEGATWCITNNMTIASTNWGITLQNTYSASGAGGSNKSPGVHFSVKSGCTATLACPFFGTGPLAKDGATGALRLTGSFDDYDGTVRLASGRLGFGPRTVQFASLDLLGGTLEMDLTGADDAQARVTADALTATNGASVGVYIAESVVARGVPYALLNAPGSTLSDMFQAGRFTLSTYGGVKGTLAVASQTDGTETLTFTATNTVTDSNNMPLTVDGDIVQTVRTAAQVAHPRLFADADGFAALKARIATDSLLQQGAAHVYAGANRLLGTTPVTYELDVSGKRLLSVSRTALLRINLLAMAYRLYGRAEHLERAKEELLAVCAFDDWHPSHFLDTAEMSLAVAIGYDWLYEYLDDASRKTVATALRTHALDASRLNLWWITAENNWGQVCHAGILAAALALAEEDPVGTAGYVQRCVNCLPISMDALAPNGNYPEGPGYWAYGVEFNVVAIALMESVLGTSYGLADMSGFEETEFYLDLVTGPSDLTFNYADGGSGRSQSFALWWFAERFNHPDVVMYRELPLLNAYTDPSRLGSGSARLFPYTLFWLKTPAEGLAPTSPLVWDSEGSVPIAIQRSSWDDDGAMFVGLKGGSPSANHGHMDGGSFILDAKRVRWAVDLGSESYAPVEANPAIGSALWTMSQDSKRWWIYRLNTWSHNLPMIDGCQQWVKGSGVVERVNSDASGSSVVMNLSTLYTNATSVVRTGTMSASGTSYTLHDVLSGVRKGGEVRWAMVTKATPTIHGSRVTLRQDGKTLFLEQVGTNTGVWQMQPAQGTNSWDSANNGCTQLYFKVTVPSSKMVDMAVRFFTGDPSAIFVR